jgi:hypothetical protein
MYVKNYSILKTSLLICGFEVKEYLISKSIPLLSIDGERYVFVYTDIVEELMENLPDSISREGVSIIGE